MVPPPLWKESATPRRAALWTSRGFSLSALSGPRCCFHPSFSPTLVSWGNGQMGFSRKATLCLLHLPSPHPALRSLALTLPWQLCRADWQLPVGQRHGTGQCWAIGPGSEPVLWMPVDTLGMCFMGLEVPTGAESIKPRYLLPVAPSSPGDCSFPSFRAPPFSAAARPWCLSPWVLWSCTLQKPQPSPPPPTCSPDSTGWTVGDQCTPGVREWADQLLNFDEEMKRKPGQQNQLLLNRAPMSEGIRKVHRAV